MNVKKRWIEEKRQQNTTQKRSRYKVVGKVHKRVKTTARRARYENKNRNSLSCRRSGSRLVCGEVWNSKRVWNTKRENWSVVCACAHAGAFGHNSISGGDADSFENCYLFTNVTFKCSVAFVLYFMAKDEIWDSISTWAERRLTAMCAVYAFVAKLRWSVGDFSNAQVHRAVWIFLWFRDSGGCSTPMCRRERESERLKWNELT